MLNLKICVNLFLWVGVDEENIFEQEFWMFKLLIGCMVLLEVLFNVLQYVFIEEVIIVVWNCYNWVFNLMLIVEYLMIEIKNEKGEIECIVYEFGW